MSVRRVLESEYSFFCFFFLRRIVFDCRSERVLEEFGQDVFEVGPDELDSEGRVGTFDTVWR
jgi:hypothetical protein